MSMKIGCTGWSFKDWYRNQFYSKKEEERFKRAHSDKNYLLWRYSQFFDCTEVNSFNYTITLAESEELDKLGVPHKAKWWFNKQLQQAMKYTKPGDPYVMYKRIQFMTRKWDASTPKDFIFSCKVPGMITHAKCLQDCAQETRMFLKGIEPVGDKLKYLLYEFPSYFTKAQFFDGFTDYFEQIPKYYDYVVEFRSADWQSPDVYEFLREQKIGLVLSEVQNEGVATHKSDMHTTDTTYVRIIGKHGVIKTFDRMEMSDNAMKTLEQWAQLVKKSRHAMVFINNNFAGNAPETANYFKSILGIDIKEWKSDLSRFLG